MDRVRITISSSDAKALRALLQQEKLDLNCGGPTRSAQGEWRIEALVPVAPVARLRASGYRIKIDE